MNYTSLQQVLSGRFFCQISPFTRKYPEYQKHLVFEKKRGYALNHAGLLLYLPHTRVIWHSKPEVLSLEIIMTRKGLFTEINFGIALLLVGSGLGGAQIAASATGQFIHNNTPKFVAKAKNLGPANPAESIDVSIWLNLHNRSAMDSLAEELYDPTSVNYHRWLTRADFATKFAPTPQEARTVEEFFVSHNLRVLTVGRNNVFVRAEGTLADVEKAFHVKINNFEVNGKIYRANATDPYVEGPAAALVQSVAGLANLKFEHPMQMQAFKNRNSPSQFATAAAHADPAFFTSHCFTGVRTEKFTTSGTFPTATYTGNGYFTSETEPGCGYTPPEIRTAYNLNGLYKEGFDGAGQTIVIIDFCGSPTILQDANVFSERFGLPPLNSSNFHITTLFAPTECQGPDAEINLDVEWAHAIAPGAKIELLIAGQGLVVQGDEAEYFAIINGLGNVISGSYGIPEADLPLTELENENLLNEIAAVMGVGANFATGDLGDYTVAGFFPTVSAPADSQYATAVGGVSLALKSDNTIAFQTGWGTNQTQLTSAGLIFDPPANYGFTGGSGGGPSELFSKPSFQAKVPGSYRQLPDISWLADPFTPGVFLITEPGQFPPQVWFSVGGTSLACPMFSALWAIANEEFAFPLGQAAPYLYSMPKGTITDVVPVTSSTNVSGTIHESSSHATHFTAAELVAPLDGTTKFYSVLADYPFVADTAYVISFGTDSSLVVTPGWDDVTGLGTPNGKAFADFFNCCR